MLQLSLKKYLKKLAHKKGATLIMGIGLSVLLLVFSVGVGMAVRSSTSNIKAFKNQWQAQLIAESVKEKMLLKANESEAGFSMENGGCQAGIIDVIYNVTDEIAGDVPDPAFCGANDNSYCEDMDSDYCQAYIQAQIPPEGEVCSADGMIVECSNNSDVIGPVLGEGSKCSINGKNNEPIKDEAGDEHYTIPNANTGDAGENCSLLQKFTEEDSLDQYSDDPDSTDIADLFGAKNPLNHPCNWGKLKFGNNENSKIVVPLYYAATEPTDLDDLDGNGVINPAESGLTELKIRLRTPCKPIAKRDFAVCEETISGNTIINTNKIGCRYKDICKPADRYQLDSGNLKVNQNETVAIWKINGQCFVNDGIDGFKEACTLAPNDRVTALKVRDLWNSEIHEEMINNWTTKFINELVRGKIAYYNTKLDLDPELNPQNDTIGNFITMQNPIMLDSVEEKYVHIEKPVLTISMVVDELRDADDNKSIPYLEYQIITNVPVSNITQQFSTEINFEGQSFLQNYSIDQSKNIVDFALQD